jgi:orotate phosphoribosyltransferase
MLEVLKSIIEKDAIVISKQPIKLSHGEETNYYYNVKRAIQQPISEYVIGRLGFQVVQSYNCNSVGGPTIGAIPIANAICYKSFFTALPVTAFFVRSKIKDYGLDNLVEGFVLGKVLIVDDVLNTGESILDCIGKIIEYKASLKQFVTPSQAIGAVMVIVNRELGLIESKLKDMNIPLVSLCKHSDFKDLIARRLENKEYDI